MISTEQMGAVGTKFVVAAAELPAVARKSALGIATRDAENGATERELGARRDRK
jgi:hypothetical protein